jgi:hypothetical protein
MSVRKEMTKYVFYGTIGLILFNGCVSKPQIDFSKIDSGCAQKCTDKHTDCMSGFKMFPIAAEQSCNNSLKLCIEACPKINSLETTYNKTTSEKLEELNLLLREGLINEDEYNSKRQEILDAI